MRPVNLDYVNTRTRRWWISVMILGAALMMTAYVLETYWQLHTNLAAEEEASTLISANRVDRSLPTSAIADSPALHRELHMAQETIGRLTLPWEKIFSALESSQIPDIALLSISPNAEDQSVSIIGEAKDYDAVLDYMQRLQRASSLTQVYLLSHRLQDQELQHPLHFEFSAHWISS